MKQCLSLQCVVLFTVIYCGLSLSSASLASEKHLVLPLIAVSLTEEEARHVEEVAKELPAIEFVIYFRFGSAVLQPKSIAQLNELGRALSSPELKDGTFVIAGYTDGLESEDFALTLSKRRAATVKEYIVQNFKVVSENLIVVGYGSQVLKDFKNPFADENRRVQIINVTKK